MAVQTAVAAAGQRLAQYQLPGTVPLQWEAGVSRNSDAWTSLSREVKKGPEVLMPKSKAQLLLAGVYNEVYEDLEEKHKEKLDEMQHRFTHVTRNIKQRNERDPVTGNVVLRQITKHKKIGSKKKMSWKNLNKLIAYSDKFTADEMVKVGHANQREARSMIKSLQSHSAGLRRRGAVMRDYGKAIRANERWLKAQTIAGASRGPPVPAANPNATHEQATARNIAVGARAIAKASQTRQFRRSREINQLGLAMQGGAPLLRPNQAPPTGPGGGYYSYPMGGNRPASVAGGPFSGVRVL